MKDIIRIGMEIEEKKDSLYVEFEFNTHKVLDEILNEKEMDELKDLTGKITKIINEGIRRNVEGTLREEEEELSEKEMIKEAIDKTSNELYEKLSEEDKKKADEFNKELEKCDSIEEAILLAIKAIKDEIKSEGYYGCSRCHKRKYGCGTYT